MGLVVIRLEAAFAPFGTAVSAILILRADVFGTVPASVLIVGREEFRLRPASLAYPIGNTQLLAASRADAFLKQLYHS